MTVPSYDVASGTVLGITVGGNGSGSSGGFNGGGNGGSSSVASAGGGGATTVSVGGVRVVVAGGGGGSGGATSFGNTAGGDAGQDGQGINGPDDPLGGGGATTSTPGAAGTWSLNAAANGTAGSGANGGAGGHSLSGVTVFGGGGGGGGYFGGGGGASASGGGGGSSFLAPGITGSIGVGGAGPRATVTYQPSGPVVSIVIAPDTSTTAAGEPTTYTAVGYSADGASVADVTATTTFTIDGGGSCAANACGSEVVGTYTVTGTNGAATDTAELEVVPADPTTLEVRPASATATAGDAATFSAVSIDDFGNEVDVTATTTFTVDGGTCLANACSSETVGAHVVTGTFGALTGTADLAVVQAAPVTLRGPPGLGDGGGRRSATFTAVSIDDFGNEVDVTATTTFTVDDGTCLANACSSETAGAHTVTGTFGALTGTADLEVVPATPVTLEVRPASATVAPGTDATFTAVSIDEFGNEIDVTASTTFTVDGGNVCSPTCAPATRSAATSSPARSTRSPTPPT